MPFCNEDCDSMCACRSAPLIQVILPRLHSSASGGRCACRYALLPDQIAAAEQQLEEVAALLQRNRQSSAQASAALPDSLMGAKCMGLAKLPRVCSQQSRNHLSTQLCLMHACCAAADDPAQLSRADNLALLQRLRDAMKQMHAQLLLRPAQVLLAVQLDSAISCGRPREWPYRRAMGPMP